MFRPIITDNEAGLPDLLQLVHCGSKGPCGNTWSCSKARLNCTSPCKEYHGITCRNVTVNEPVIDNDEYKK